jgi:hypothetical protein
VLVFPDGDSRCDTAQLETLLEPIERDEADLVRGARTADGSDSALMTHQWLSSVVVTNLVGLLYGRKITDLPEFEAIRRRVLQRPDRQEMTDGWTVEMIVKFLRCGYRVM